MGSDRAKLGITLGGGKRRSAFKMRTLRFLNVDHAADRQPFARGDFSHRFAARPGFLNARSALRCRCPGRCGTTCPAFGLRKPLDGLRASPVGGSGQRPTAFYGSPKPARAMTRSRPADVRKGKAFDFEHDARSKSELFRN